MPEPSGATSSPEHDDGRERAEGEAVASPASLADPWDRHGALPLDGYFERAQFSPLLMGVMVLVLLWLFFNLVGSVAMGVFLAARGETIVSEPGMSLAELQAQIPVDVATLANSIGLGLGLGLPILGVAWFHSRRVGAFLRLRGAPWGAVGLALVGLVTLTPVVGWLGTLNQMVPLPDMLQQMEDARMGSIGAMIERLGLPVILFALAVVPAVCEEVAFRGYAQRQFERSLGAAGGIALTGFLFGVYHASFAQLLPLAALGCYLGYLTWRTGSLWPAAAVHFANNAFSVVSTRYAAARSDVPLAEMEGGTWPWYVVLGGLIFSGVVLFLLHSIAPRWQPGGQARPGTAR